MKTLIAIPCMDTVCTPFFSSVLNLEKEGVVEYRIVSGTLIYDARNQLAQYAISSDCDQVLWLDSDMVFEPDLLRRLSKDISDGMDFVTGLYFSRRKPIRPCIFQSCEVLEEDGKKIPTAAHYCAYPNESVFEIAAAGFGCVMTTRRLLEEVVNRFGKMPFSPAVGFGEDLSFCMRTSGAGFKMFCDSRIKVGHIARVPIGEGEYQWQRQQTQ